SVTTRSGMGGAFTLMSRPTSNKMPKDTVSRANSQIQSLRVLLMRVLQTGGRIVGVLLWPPGPLSKLSQINNGPATEYILRRNVDGASGMTDSSQTENHGTTRGERMLALRKARMAAAPPILRGGFRPFFFLGSAWAALALGAWI